MRYPLIRSFLRTAIAVGVVASYQSSLFAWSWRELLQPHAGVCILHDLYSDQNNGASQSQPETEIIANSKLSRVNAEVSVQDFDICGMESIENDSYASRIQNEKCIEAAKEFEFRSQLIAAWAEIESGSSLLMAQSKRLYSVFGQSSNTLLSLMKSNSLKLVEWIQIPEMRSVTVLQTEQIAEANDAFESEWNCTAWEHIVAAEETANLPVRDRANIYVFTFHTSDADACTEVATMLGQTEQVGTEKNSENTWQVGVDPVCPEIHLSNNAFHWSDLCEQPMVCCPFDGRSYVDAIADSKAVCIEDAILPPTLESDFDFSVHPDGIGHCLVQADPISPQIAIDFAMKHLLDPSEDVQFQASKSIVKQIRSTGQFLIDIASKIEAAAERVELARRDSNQR